MIQSTGRDHYASIAIKRPIGLNAQDAKIARILVLLGLNPSNFGFCSIFYRSASVHGVEFKPHAMIRSFALAPLALALEVVTNRVVIPQIQALRLARSTIGGDAIRASLCRADGGFIYIITMLARDGKLERIRIKGETGEQLPAKKD